ncbi:MAG: hypothetical protein JKX94_06895 [Sneathiella sp.]|nr:hypothetical protein [Sneathiella sp.]
MPFSRSTKPAAPDWLISRPIAHRGLHDRASGAIENSMTAFRRAKDAGLPIELDVHLSSDHVPVVFHDETLERVAGDPRRVCDVPAKELEQLPLYDSKDSIPNLRSVFDMIAGSVPLVIELKQSPLGRKILAQKVWEVLRDYQGLFAVQSFDPIILKWFRQNAPKVIRGQLAMKSPPRKMPAYRKFFMRHMLLNGLSKPHYIGYYCEDIDNWTVRWAVKSNMRLLAWTVSSKEQLDHARQHADNIIFENLPLDLVI